MISALKKKGGGVVVEGEPEPKKKPGLALLIASGKSHDEPDEDEDMPEEFSASFDEFVDALKSDDAEGAKAALYAAISCCK